MKLEIKNISKQYGKKTVLQGVSQEFSGAKNTRENAEKFVVYRIMMVLFRFVAARN